MDPKDEFKFPDEQEEKVEVSTSEGDVEVEIVERCARDIDGRATSVGQIERACRGEGERRGEIGRAHV